MKRKKILAFRQKMFNYLTAANPGWLDYSSQVLTIIWSDYLGARLECVLIRINYKYSHVSYTIQ